MQKDVVIYRQAAIDAAIEAVDSWDGCCNIGRQKRIHNAMMQLPPMQPTYTDEEIQKMQDIEQAQLEKAFELGMQKGEPMADCMTFPDTVEEFMEQYKITDTKQIYTNGTELVPIFRMKQWFEHQTDRMKFVQEAVNTLMNTSKTNSVKDKCFRNAARFVQNAIDGEL